jgi:Holliday junction resolvasome RuvABC endonuclease subunit
MKILGLDIATNTGYCILNDGKLETYGMINLLPEMNILQRISFFENNILKLLDEYKPDYVAIEDLIMGISGVKVLSYLARLSGVALSCCYKKVGNNISLFTPSEWKAASFDGLNGTSKKYEIQICVCKHFNLVNETELNNIIQPLDNIKDDSECIKTKLELIKNDTKKYLAYLNRKRNGCKNDSERKSFQNKINENKAIINTYTSTINENKKHIEDIYKNISLEIMSKCGLTCDVSDSIGIAYCLWKKMSS